MEASGTVPRGGIEAPDLGAVMAGEGPFLTVYLATEGAVENAVQRSEQRWKALRRELADQSAPESALAAIDPLVGDAHTSGAGLLAIADASEVLLVEHLVEAPAEDHGSWSRLPVVVPLLAVRQAQVPYVLVLADRGGADLLADRPGREPVTRTVGEGEPDSKTSPGGWSQRRFQERAENDWANTAGDVAERATRLAKAVDARVVIIGGDVRASHMIRDDLPGELAAISHLIEHGRAADGSDDEREREVERLVATAVAEDTVAFLQKFREECGQQDRAVQGADATVNALNRAAVDVLLVAEGPSSDRTASVGPDPVPVALDGGGDIAGTRESTTEASLPDALVRAAIGTGASIRIVPSGPVPEGIGALLRWANPTP